MVGGLIALLREPMIIPTSIGWRSSSGREGGHAASFRGAGERGGALSQAVAPGWIEAADEVLASLPSLARREARRESLGRR